MTAGSYTSPMTRLRLLTTIAFAALAYAAIAVAGPGPATTSPVTATFFANTLTNSHSQTQTCTAAGGDAYAITHATFTGTASSSDTRLAGPVTVDVISVYDSTKNLGWLNGDLRISPATPSPGHVHAHLTAVNVNGNVQGSIWGDLGAGARLLGSFSGTFSPTGGFGSSSSPVSIGAGTGTNTAIVTSGNCGHSHDDDQGNSHSDDQHGPKHD
jgi:hypothetical protein